MYKLMIITIFALTGCVTAGYEGQIGTFSETDQMMAQREANRTIALIDPETRGYEPFGNIAVRRCHRNFLEEEPSREALLSDLKRAAYADGADAISDISETRKNGLMANCWYVVEASARTWRRR